MLHDRTIDHAVNTHWAQQLAEERMATMIGSLRMLVQILGVSYVGSISEIRTRPRRHQRP